MNLANLDAAEHHAPSARAAPSLTSRLKEQATPEGNYAGTGAAAVTQRKNAALMESLKEEPVTMNAMASPFSAAAEETPAAAFRSTTALPAAGAALPNSFEAQEEESEAAPFGSPMGSPGMEELAKESPEPTKEERASLKKEGPGPLHPKPTAKVDLPGHNDSSR